jgi:hypothetical protein
LCDVRQGSGLRGRTSTALVRTEVLPYYKGKDLFSARPLRIELTEVLNVLWIG